MSCDMAGVYGRQKAMYGIYAYSMPVFETGKPNAWLLSFKIMYYTLQFHDIYVTGSYTNWWKEK